MTAKNQRTGLIFDFSGDTAKLGRALSSLLSLSDSKESVEKFNGSIAITFTDYTSDSRELYEIPQVVNYMAELTKQWPFWLHFVIRERLPDGTTPLHDIIRILAPPTVVVRGRNGQVGAKYDFDKVDKVVSHLWLEMDRLHSSYQLDEDVIITVNDELSKSIARMFQA